MSDPDVLIVGGGVGGLALALSLHQAGISARVFEAAPDVLPLGVGINLLPHAMRELSELGLQEALARDAIETRELAFYSRHGQFIYKEPRGRFAGYDWPQLSIHRADLHKVMLDTVRARLGSDAVRLAHRCLKVDQDGTGVMIHFDDIEPQRGRLAVGCDGIHSAL
ncbi:MAG TPA: FAD-dependent monooxygenase, partial [Reyranella sp.]|nr:FAD-dependent monooxygenase [Reyranella sp.]